MIALSWLAGRIVAWLRAGYPAGVPERDYLPLLAVLGRRLTPAEVEHVVAELTAGGVLPGNRVDTAVAITTITHELPSETDLARVRDRLIDGGWPITESWRDHIHPDVPKHLDAGDPGVRSLRRPHSRDVAQLATLLHTICLRDRTAIATATLALLRADLEHAERAIDIGRDIEAMSGECEHEILRLLSLRFPVAAELREIGGALQVLANLRRMGALATHVAELARRRHPAAVVPETVRPLVERLGAATIAIATSAAEVLLSRDSDAAVALDTQDDTIDNLHEQLLAAIVDSERGHEIAAAVDIALLGRYYERFADNAVDIGRRTLPDPAVTSRHRH
ncbi:DUF3349 domain-containing protein [Nocardia bovistercoris]|uniref:DUF3349 domain-containing protein n=1 Tax=Nocardia bovistercoris TaxID=2785916 RepID=A0A931N762_9NOCA|nr:DUF3349 domain-containing protein [Nocardia bovistercoris]MBH0781447.1 DUF3349 domain-containing protein [Nocardia bovistercoris]